MRNSKVRRRRDGGRRWQRLKLRHSRACPLGYPITKTFADGGAGGGPAVVGGKKTGERGGRHE